MIRAALSGALRRPDPLMSLWSLLAVVGIAMPFGWIVHLDIDGLPLVLELLSGAALAAVVAFVLRVAPRRLPARNRLAILAEVAGVAIVAAGVAHDPVPLVGIWVGLCAGPAIASPARDPRRVGLAVTCLTLLIQAVWLVVSTLGVKFGLMALGVIVCGHALWIACAGRKAVT